MTHWKDDPFSEREANNYDNPVPSREYIQAYLEKVKEPQSHRALCLAFDLKDDAEQVEALRRRLRAMQRDGQLIRNRKGAYGLVSKMDLIKGRVQAHRDGYGFLIPEDGSDDLYLTFREMRSVFDGDIVLARVSGVDRKGRREGALVEVLEHKTTSVVGRYREESGVGFVEPDNPRINHDILVPPSNRAGAKNGQLVVATITQQPSGKGQVQAEISEVLGEHMAPGMEIDVAIRSHEIPYQWPNDVLQDVEQLPDFVTEGDKKNRIDIRHLPLVTIDGEDARDFDDAVYCERKKSGGWRLLVAIADVSHYVRAGGALDQEAYRRGTSVYFPERVIPMLPEKLSNGLCSLNPQVDRLCLVCEMSVSDKGKVSRYRFFEGLMLSHARLTYTRVADYLDVTNENAHKQFDSEYPGLGKHITELYNLYQVLRESRNERGAIDFDTNETRIIFGVNKKIEQIVPTIRNDAHKIIEECMLCANVAAAKVVEKYKLPALFRVHEGPKEEKLANLREFLFGIGFSLPGGGKPTPNDYQQLLSGIQDRPDRHIIETVMLRSLSQAVYTPQNQGHFGLNYPSYTHFTSPIRRYPDLELHRCLRYLIRSEPTSPNVLAVEGAKTLPKSKWLTFEEAKLVQLGEHTSMTERRADDATRDVVDWLKCEFMLDHVGESFRGVISSVTAFGFFVELSGVYVEGLVHVSSLKSDYYHFDAISHALTGESSRLSFSLGDEVEVLVAKVNLDDRKIDFELLELIKKASGKKPRGGKSSAGGKSNKKERSGFRGGKKKLSEREKIARGQLGKSNKSRSKSAKSDDDKKGSGKQPTKNKSKTRHRVKKNKGKGRKKS